MSEADINFGKKISLDFPPLLKHCKCQKTIALRELKANTVCFQNTKIILHLNMPSSFSDIKRILKISLTVFCKSIKVHYRYYQNRNSNLSMLLSRKDKFL
jgi:hypothetical protein